MTEHQSRIPILVRILAILLFLFSLFAFFGSLFMWGEGFLLQFPEGADYRFPITDILVTAPASMIAAIGLWGMRRYGYVVSQFVAGFYIYASVEIFVEVVQAGPPYVIEIIVPQIMAVAVAATLVVYSWRIREMFGGKR
ncbi:hypothetical protein KA005_80985 [bacterium]|nr:hypothetical protein [bacterium]